LLQEAERATQTSGKRKLDAVPSSYHKKYEHLLGKEAAKDAARATDANKSYGFGNFSKHIVTVMYSNVARIKLNLRLKLWDIK